MTGSGTTAASPTRGRAEEMGQVVHLDAGRRSNGQPPEPPVPALGSDLLHRVALTLNSTLELRDVLHRLATLALEETQANRCSLFLLDGTELHPTVALGIREDEDLWAAFQEMGPVELSAIPNAESLLGGLSAIPIEDAASSELIPPEWTQRFALESLVIVPLHAADEPCGIITLDFARRSFSVDELRLLEALAAYAGVAIRNARTFEQARRRASIQEALATGARELTTTGDESRVADALVDAYTRVLGASGCAIGLFDHRQRRITTVATSRPADVPVAPLPFSEIPESIVERLTSGWEQRLRPITFGPQAWFEQLVGERLERHVVLPLTVQGDVCGAVVLGFARARQLDDEELTACRTLAAMGSAVLERTSLTQRLEANIRRLEVLSAVSGALVDGADAPALVARLNSLLGGQGVQVVALSLRDRDLARVMRAEDPLPEERRIRGRNAAPVAIDDLLAVPLLLNNRMVGTLRVRPATLGEDEKAFIEAIGRGVADVITRGALRSSVERLALDQAVSTVRDVMVADLHDTVSQFFAAIGLLARGDMERLPRDTQFAVDLKKIAALADSGRWEIDQAVRALAHVPGGDRGLPTALADLAVSFGADSGIRVLVDVEGPVEGLSPDVERVLYRVAHEALVNSWRHGRCSLVRMSLTFDEHIGLQVRDDGVGFGRHSGDRVSGVGLQSLRRLLRGVGGNLSVGNAKPRGALLTATVPVPHA